MTGKGKDWPTQIIPIHGESTESWLVRCAYSYQLSLERFMTHVFKEQLGIDLDLWTRDKEWVRHTLLSLSDGKYTEDFTMSQYVGRIGTDLREIGRWMTFSERKGGMRGERRFCPQCLKDDVVPHFRLGWRLTFAPVCLIHKFVLSSRCQNCGMLVQFWRANPTCEIGRCWKCGESLALAKPERKASSGELDAVSSLVRRASGTRAPSDAVWSGTIPELFQSLRIVMLMLRSINIRLVTQRNTTRYGLEDPDVGLQLVFQGWELIKSPPELARIIGENRRAFNQVSQYHCTPFLEPYRVSMWKIGLEKIRNAMRNVPYELVDARFRLPLVALGNATGYPRERLAHLIHHDREAMEFWRETQPKIRQARIEKMNMVLVRFERDGVYPTFKSVGQVWDMREPRVGVKGVNIRYASYLKEMVLLAQVRHRLSLQS